jgi:hypothetical protein
MGRYVTLQSNFSVGEIDPLVRARLDLQQYYNACETGRNVLFQPQGGFRWRPGTRFLFQLPAAANPGSGVKCVPFEFSVTDSYMLVFVNNRMYVFKNEVLITDINAITDQDYLVTSIASARLAEMCWTQSGDTLIVVEKDMAPKKIVRGATDADWTITDITFDSIPLYQFTTTTINEPAQTLTPSSTTGNIVLTAGGAVFAAGDVGKYINAEPAGRARIVGFTSTSVVSAVVEIPFFSTGAIASGSWDLEGNYEPVWSTARGWPTTCVFHEGRLFFGGSKSRPSTIWGSRVGEYYEFQASTGFADDAVEQTTGSGRFNAVTDILSGRDLQVFTTGGEYFVPQLEGQAISPDNFFIKTATPNGSRIGVRVQQIESGTLYVQREGKALQEFLFNDVELAYVSNKISLLSGHLLRSPKRMALRRATSTDEGDLLLITNDTDGTMGAWMLLRSQNVIAPSLWDTDGSFIDVAVDVDTIYTVVERQIDSDFEYYVEVFDLDLNTDCAFTGGAASSASGIPYTGMTVDLKLDGMVQEQQVVNGSGAITFPRAAATSYELGLPFTPIVTTMPAEPRLAAGARVGFKKRIPQVNTMVKDTQHFTVNGQEVSFRNFGSTLLDETVEEFTGTKRIGGLLGYSQEAQITYSRTVPLKATILGVDYRVSVHGGT